MSVEDRVKSIIVEQLGVDADEVTPDASFVEDLGADSLDTVELIMAFEEEFGVEISDDEAEKIRKVRDAVEYICKIAGEVRGFEPEKWIEKKEVKKSDTFIHYAVVAAQMAFDDAKLDSGRIDGDRLGVIVGSGIGGLPLIEEMHRKLLERGPSRISPFFIPGLIVNLAAGQISIRFGARGPNSAPATACATGAHAIGDAYKIIQRDEADVMFAGGSEAVVTPLAVGGFSAMRALSTRNGDPEHASRPWDLNRDGFVMGEG